MTGRERPPIIIIGMHRSGTSILARMLGEVGMFIGNKIDHYSEAAFFFRINERLFEQSGAVWDNPKPFNHLLNDTQFRNYAVMYIKFLMKSPSVITFLGLNRYLGRHTLENFELPWGWKDPRNTYTLPIWLDIFPNAKIIHICRHGVDVAQSLKERHEMSIGYRNNNRSPRKLLYWLMLKKHPCLTLRCATLEGGISLWEEYMHQARSHVERHKEMAMEVKYEEFLSEPVDILKNVSEFCELSPKDTVLTKIAKSIEKKRAYAYLSSPDLRQFAQQMTDRLKVFGY